MKHRAQRKPAGILRRVAGAGMACLITTLPIAACDGPLGDAVGAAPAAALPSVVFVSTAPPGMLPAEEAAAWEWLQLQPELRAEHVQFVDLANARLPREAVLWWHYADDRSLPSVAVRPETLAVVRRHLRSGGGVLLTLFAAAYVVPLGIESAPPDTVDTRAPAADGPLFGGLQSRLGHPLLARFWGGAFTSGTADASLRPVAAYTGDRWPANGSVWAVDKTERSVDASIKIGVEYPTVDALGGHLITLGANCYFADTANPNRPQLSRIIADSLLYLGDNNALARDTEESDFVAAGDLYWRPGESVDGIVRTDVAPTDVRLPADMGSILNDVEAARSGIEMVGFPTADVAAPFTIASPTAVVYGSQMGRIEAFWAHPLRILRNLRFAVVRPDRGVTWLDTGGGDRTFTARPEGSELVYTDGEIQVSLRFAVDRRHGAFVALIAVRSPAALDLVATWEIDLSSDWPRRQPVLGPLEIAWDEGAQAIVWRDQLESYRAMAGFGGAPSLSFFGFDPERHIDEGGLLADQMLSGGRVATQVRIEPEPGRPTLVSFVAVGGYAADPNAAAVYTELSARPGGPWTANAAYYRKFLDVRTLNLITPDIEFNNLFKWAKVGTEALRVSSASVGSGIFAGYGPTSPEERRSPLSNAFGGNDTLWASMAADAYGDSSLSADTLRLLARFQAIDGRIPSAVSLAWQLRYDDAAATPMFLIAVDNHVRAWGSRGFLEGIWPTVSRAVEYGFAADRDNDGLIDSLSDADRWYAGRDIRTTIHLAALWGAALDAVEHLATAMNDPELAGRCRDQAVIVRQSLNEQFWNPAGRDFHFAVLSDGRFADARSVLSAVPMVFNLLDTGIANAPLDSFGADELTVDWGVALASTEPADVPSETPAETLPPPRRLPEHAAETVSPLFTGWAALAEYANHRPESGFLHSVSNLETLRYNNLGYASESLDRLRLVPARGMPHSAASQAMTILPVVWGMLGIRPDATARTIEIAPHIPAGWSRVIVDKVRLGADEFRIQIRRTPTTTEFRIERLRGNQPVTFRLGAHVPTDVVLGFDRASLTGAELVAEDGVDEIIAESSVDKSSTVRITPTENNVTAVFRHGPFPELIPEPPLLQPGQGSSGLRVIRSRYLGETLSLQLEGLPGQAYALRLATPWPVSQVTGIPDISFANLEPGRALIEVAVPGTGIRYRSIDLEVSFQR